jgi:hypothetical protein
MPLTFDVSARHGGGDADGGAGEPRHYYHHHHHHHHHHPPPPFLPDGGRGSYAPQQSPPHGRAPQKRRSQEYSHGLQVPLVGPPGSPPTHAGVDGTAAFCDSRTAAAQTAMKQACWLAVPSDLDRQHHHHHHHHQVPSPLSSSRAHQPPPCATVAADLWEFDADYDVHAGVANADGWNLLCMESSDSESGTSSLDSGGLLSYDSDTMGSDTSIESHATVVIPASQSPSVRATAVATAVGQQLLADRTTQFSSAVARAPAAPPIAPNRCEGAAVGAAMVKVEPNLDPEQQATCPICDGDKGQRLGKYWKKFGYNGPMYCSSCASVFRAHILTENVSPHTCSRTRPCKRCAPVLEGFQPPLEKVFALMDASQPRSRHSHTAKRKSHPGPAARRDADASCGDHCGGSACPLCHRTEHPGLGTFWAKHGYTGPPYCATCSATFRNHIIRQRGHRQPRCTRHQPCPCCTAILSHFDADNQTVYHRMDRNNAHNMVALAQKVESKAQRASVDGSCSCPDALPAPIPATHVLGGDVLADGLAADFHVRGVNSIYMPPTVAGEPLQMATSHFDNGGARRRKRKKMFALGAAALSLMALVALLLRGGSVTVTVGQSSDAQTRPSAANTAPAAGPIDDRPDTTKEPIHQPVVNVTCTDMSATAGVVDTMQCLGKQGAACKFVCAPTLDRTSIARCTDVQDNSCIDNSCARFDGGSCAVCSRTRHVHPWLDGQVFSVDERMLVGNRQNSSASTSDETHLVASEALVERQRLVYQLRIQIGFNPVNRTYVAPLYSLRVGVIMALGYGYMAQPKQQSLFVAAVEAYSCPGNVHRSNNFLGTESEYGMLSFFGPDTECNLQQSLVSLLFTLYALPHEQQASNYSASPVTSGKPEYLNGTKLCDGLLIEWCRTEQELCLANTPRSVSSDSFRRTLTKSPVDLRCCRGRWRVDPGILRDTVGAGDPCDETALAMVESMRHHSGTLTFSGD